MVALLVSALASCSAVIDDELPECKDGLELRFIYDYNMEFANAFPSQVDCLTVLVYTEEGQYIGTYTESGEPLADEDYRMHIPLEPGKYRIVAWGGLQCEKASFAFTANPAQAAMTALQVRLNPALLTSPVGSNLHNLFYGELEAEIVKRNTLQYTTYTVPMMKDTNNIRVILQNLSLQPLSDSDFEFSITDDNTLLAWNNAVVPTSTITYSPWITGTVTAGQNDEGTAVVGAYAELSTSRLIASHNARLKIRNVKTDTDIIDIPLIDFLLMLKSQQFESMGNQEFLDRESRWALTFFLQGTGTWMSAYVKINDWVVRLNNIDFGS